MTARFFIIGVVLALASATACGDGEDEAKKFAEEQAKKLEKEKYGDNVGPAKKIDVPIMGGKRIACTDMITDLQAFKPLFNEEEDLTMKDFTRNSRQKGVNAVCKLNKGGEPLPPEEQAKLMERYIDVLSIIHLTCDDETAMFERLRRRALKSNRHDDADEKVIRHRWEVYEHETAPVLSHYPREVQVEINSIGSPAQILHDILEGLVPVQDRIFRSADV